MDRATLLLQLADLVSKKRITEAEAARLIDQYDAGEFVPPPDLPPQEDSGNEWLLALLLLLLLTKGNTATRISAAKRTFARNTLRRGFENDMSRLANGLTTGKMPLQAWQSEMQATISRYTRQMATAGAGKLPSGAVQAAVEASLSGQSPFLRRFATEVAARAAAGRPMSERAVAARAKLYGGSATAGYWRGEEEAQVGGRRDYVVYYQSMDDPGVCGPCASAQRMGPYLPGTNYPLPGRECVARGGCRCYLRFEFAPEIWQQLSGQRRAA